MGSDIDQLMESGKQKFFRFDRDGALEEFRKASSQDPDNPTILGWTAITLVMLENYDEATNIIETIKDNNYAVTCFVRGLIANIRDNKYEAAIEYIDEAVSLDETDEFFYVVRGNAYLGLDLLEEANEDFTRALEVNPTSYVYFVFGSYRRHNLNDIKGALADFSKATELDDKFDMAWYQSGELKHTFLEDYEGALADYNRVINLNPQNDTAWANRGSLKHDMQDFQGALTDYTEAIKLNPTYWWAYYKRGSLKYDNLEDIHGALEDFNQSISINPDYQFSLVDRGFLREDEEEDYLGALSDYTKAIDIDPEYVWALYSRGSLNHIQLKNYNDALDDYSKVINLDPEHQHALAQRGVIRDKLGDAKGALDDLTKALNIDKNNSYALSMRAYVLESLGNYELAIADRARYHKVKGKKANSSDNEVIQDICISVHEHFQTIIKPKIDSNGETFVEYWEGVLYWAAERTQMLDKGKQSYVHHGRYGIGYLCLTDKYLRIISIGGLSWKYRKELGLGLGKKVLITLFRNLDMRKTEKKDKQWNIPVKNINEISSEDMTIQIMTQAEVWKIILLTEFNEYVVAALELARTGNLRKLVTI